MTNLELEIQKSIKFLMNFDAQKIQKFIEDIKPPVLVAAMGSSFYLPCGRSKNLVTGFSHHPDINFIFASEGYATNPDHWESLILVSNSGETREVIELGKKFKNKKIYAITATSGSTLSRIADKTFILESGKEKAVAATKSIIEQSVILESLVRKISTQRQLTVETLQEVAIAMNNNIKNQIPSNLLVLVSGARSVYFVGGSGGIGEELALKFSELGKKKSAFIAGTQILHGTEEVIEKGDVVFLLFADRYRDYYDRFAKMKEKTGCYIFTIGDKAPFSDVALDIDLISGFKPYCILSYFWNFLTEFAKIKGFSLDKGEKIEKVGVKVN